MDTQTVYVEDVNKLTVQWVVEYNLKTEQFSVNFDDTESLSDTRVNVYDHNSYEYLNDDDIPQSIRQEIEIVFHGMKRSLGMPADNRGQDTLW